MKMKTTLALLWLSLLFLTTNLSVNAQPVNTSLTLAVLSPPTEKECTIEATLKDENGNPLSNMDISFTECGQIFFGTNKTDSNGVASLKLTLTERDHLIYAVFDGTTNYAPSRSEDVFIPARANTPDYIPYIVGIPAVTIIGIVGYIVFRRRKSWRNMVS